MGTKNIYYTKLSGINNKNYIKNYIIEVKSEEKKKESFAPNFIENNKKTIKSRMDYLFLWFDNLIQKEFLDAR